MRSLSGQVEEAMARALERTDPALAGADPVVRPGGRADFQSNAALALAARAGTAPAELAGRLATSLRAEAGSALATVSVSGPGFVNLTLGDAVIWDQVVVRLADPGRLGVGGPWVGRRVLIDYAGPNVAKEMHVGHLRTTILGDCLARVLGHLGADVLRRSHLGDWGTQFGMLIQYADENGEGGDELEALYRAARARFEVDPDFAGRARARVVALQSGDPATVARWREIVAASEQAFQRVLDRLGLLLTPDDAVGESYYQRWLAEVADELAAAGIAVPSEGALCVFPEDGDGAPLLVRKSDGGYGYDTTDLAALRHRARDLGVDRILYVVDARQAPHFAQVFAAGRRAGWIGPGIGVEAVHVSFGAMLGPDGKPFKTRYGDTVKLADLLDAAVERARATVAEKSPHLDGAALDRIAEQVGIGAVKYAELSTSRAKDYVFDLDRMVSLRGDTGVYLQYAHARLCSLLAKAGDTPIGVDLTVPPLPVERALALALDGYGDALAATAATLEPHRLCGHLYTLARTLSAFYEVCPVLTAPEPERDNRLALCRLAAYTLRQGLDLLGLAAPDRL
jgi:arginyl-tRNA synthetase